MSLDGYLADKPAPAHIVRERLGILARYSGSHASGPPGAQARMVGYAEHDPIPPDQLWESLCSGLVCAGERPQALYRAVVAWGRSPGHGLAVVAEAIGAECVYASCMTMECFCDWLEEQKLALTSTVQAYDQIRRSWKSLRRPVRPGGCGESH